MNLCLGLVMSLLRTQRWGHVALPLSAQCCLWRYVSLCVPFISVSVRVCVYACISVAKRLYVLNCKSSLYLVENILFMVPRFI